MKGKLATFVMGMFLDGEDKHFDWLVEACRDEMTPEEMVRGYLRKTKDKSSSIEEQMRLGLRWKVLECVSRLVDQGFLSKREKNTQVIFSVTEKGFRRCTVFDKSSPWGRAPLEYTLSNFKTGRFWLKLVPREVPDEEVEIEEEV